MKNRFTLIKSKIHNKNAYNNIYMPSDIYLKYINNCQLQNKTTSENIPPSVFNDELDKNQSRKWRN